MLRTLLLLVVVLWVCGPVHPQWLDRPSGPDAVTAPQLHAGTSVADPLLNFTPEPQRPILPLLPPPDNGMSAWQSAGVGALIGLGVGSAVGLVITDGSLKGGGLVPPGLIFGFCAGTGTVLGGVVGLLAGSSSGGGEVPYPGY